MGLDALLQHLEQNATQEAARLRSAAEERATEIVAGAEADAARRRALHVERVTAERRTAGERRVAAARAEAGGEFLRVRAGVLARVFERAAMLLQDMRATQYAPHIEHLARDAVRFLERGPAVLQCPADGAPALADAVRGLLHITVQPASVPAGVTGRSGDGRVLVDNSLPALLARRRPEVTIGLVARIEGR